MTFPVTPTFKEFEAALNGATVAPVWVEAVADAETPLSVFRKIGASAPSFLFESAEQSDLVGRHSIVGAGARHLLVARGQQVRLRCGGADKTFEVKDDPLKELERLLAAHSAVRHAELPGFWGGAVGYLAYDAIRWIEPSVPPPPEDPLGLPDLFFMIPERLVLFDHKQRRMRIVAPAFLEGVEPKRAYADALDRILLTLAELRQPAPIQPLFTAEVAESVPATANTTRAEYHAMVEKAREYIRAGDIFQVVPSQRFQTPFDGDPVDLYRALRFVNPSPYLFCLRCEPGFALVGSSPELHVRLTDGLVEIRPIAGTRPRGADAAEDERLAADLLADPKERAEHLMLVDLARNDVGRIAEFGSVKVSDFMTIERYSHVMHIVSHVSGQLAGGRNAFDVMRATFPAGTVSGSPKVRAMQIINELEKHKRCSYAGAVGYFGFDGNLDSCIALRTVALKDGIAYVQSGGGVVADSTPEGEYMETVNKAKAALRAVDRARTIAGGST